MKKKAQIQNMETIATVIIVIIIIIFALSYGASKREDEVDKISIEEAERQLMDLAITIIGLEELKCSDFSAATAGCVDMYRVKSLSKLINASDPGLGLEAHFFYYNIFGTSDINIKIIDFEGSHNKINLYNYSDSEWVNKSKINVHMPVIVQNPVTKFNNFGLLEVITYI